MASSDEVDPRVAVLVTQIRDRFGVSGMRSAIALLEQEITVAEAALLELRDA